VSILDRYIAREFWKGFLAAFTTLFVLYISGDAMRQGLSEDIPAIYALQYMLYRMPENLVMLLAPACLMGTLICLSGFSRRSELIAMFASGVSLMRIAFVILSLVFMLCCISFIVTDRVVPPLTKLRNQFYRSVIQKRPDLHTEIKQSKIWYRSKNLIYNLRVFEPKLNRIQGISIYTFDDNFDLVQRIEAQTADFINGKWALKNGLITVFDGKPVYPAVSRFKEQLLSLPEGPDDFKEIEKEVETLRLKSLWTYIQRNKKAGIDTHSYEVAFWSKISISIVPLIMSVLGIPFAVQNQRHSSLAKDISICFTLIVVYWFIFSTCLSMGRSGQIPPVAAAWGPNMLFFATGIFLLLRRKSA
jgi:lipopolysaccharide export system permease protein